MTKGTKVAAKKATNGKRIEATSPKPETVLVLRTCDADMHARGCDDGITWDFVWPESGPISAPDWRDDKECGHGLHGLLWGEGDQFHLKMDKTDRKWLVVEVEKSKIRDLGGKVKFQDGLVLHAGDRKTATQFIAARAPRSAVIGLIWEVGDNGALTGGYGSTLTGGYGSTLTGGDGSTLTGGARSTLTGGYGSTLTGGDGSTLTGGDGSTLTGGDGSTLTGGDGSEFRLRWWDGNRYRTKLAYVGEDGIEAGAKYRVIGKELVKIEDAPKKTEAPEASAAQ